jgi:hypothetical protein
VLLKPATSPKLYMAYHTLQPTPFRYTYLFADMKLILNMRDFLIKQGRLEYQKTRDDDERGQAQAW